MGKCENGKALSALSAFYLALREILRGDVLREKNTSVPNSFSL
jgi:hypothetical protein